MARKMGIRELKAHMSQVINDVRAGESVEITSHGEVVALLVPAPRRLSEGEIKAALTSLDSLAAEIGKQVKGPTNVADLLSSMRR
jgi:prevent-host-death family protein